MNKNYTKDNYNIVIHTILMQLTDIRCACIALAIYVNLHEYFYNDHEVQLNFW